MFAKKKIYINAIKQNNQLKIESKKIKGAKEEKGEISTFLVEEDFLPENISQKLNLLQEESDFSYLSTILLSDTTRLIPKATSSIKDCEVINFNASYNIAVLKTALFETQNYFAKTGIDFIYSAFHIIDSHIIRHKLKSELIVFIYNNRAYIVIVDKTSAIIYNEVVDLLTFDAIKKTHFYEDDLERQKLYDELYYLEFNELLEKVLKDFYSKQKEIFVQKITILYTLKSLTKEQLLTLGQELMLRIDTSKIDLEEELFDLSKDYEKEPKSFIKPRKKKKKRDFRYVFVFFIFALLMYGAYKFYTIVDFNKLASKLTLAKTQQETILDKLPDHVLLNSKIEERIKAVFRAIPAQVMINELKLTNDTLELKIVAKDDENLELLKLALNALYLKNDSSKLDNTKVKDFEATINSKNTLDLENISYKVFTKDYLTDEKFNQEDIEEQLSILLPKDSIIDYIKKVDANKVEIFCFNVSTILKDPQEFFNILDKLNKELYSINILGNISIKNIDLGLEVSFELEFNQLK